MHPKPLAASPRNLQGELQMLAQFLLLALRVPKGQHCVGEHSLVGPLQTQRSLHQRDQLLKAAPVLIVVDQVLELVGIARFSYIQAAHLRQPEQRKMQRDSKPKSFLTVILCISKAATKIDIFVRRIAM